MRSKKTHARIVIHQDFERRKNTETMKIRMDTFDDNEQENIVTLIV